MKQIDLQDLEIQKDTFVEKELEPAFSDVLYRKVKEISRVGSEDLLRSIFISQITLKGDTEFKKYLIILF